MDQAQAIEKESQEIVTVKRQTTKALTAAEALTIASPEDYTKATDMLSMIKSVGKTIKERKEAITRPLMDGLNSARDLFKPIEQDHMQAESLIKRKMLDFNDEQDRARAEETARLAARVEKGTMKPETAMRKMEALPEVQNSVQGKVGMATTRIVKKYRVIDESALPREFLIPNMVRITEALKAGQVVPGAEVYEEKTISAR